MVGHAQIAPNIKKTEYIECRPLNKVTDFKYLGSLIRSVSDSLSDTCAQVTVAQMATSYGDCQPKKQWLDCLVEDMNAVNFAPHDALEPMAKGMQTSEPCANTVYTLG